MKRIMLIIPALVAFLASCRQPAANEGLNPGDLYGNALTVSGTRFVDSGGREVILNGINYVCKDSSLGYIIPDSESTFRHFREWGMNCIRLGIIWDGVEPSPGKYDEAYLDQVAGQVRWAEENGLYVMLDMHQDLFGVSFSDGAPAWATITDGQPHATGSVWSDSYFISPAVQHAFDNFWANAPAPDGIGVQDHYARMWQHIAKRFADTRAVVGYDLMNEPFNGTPGTMILPAILTGYAGLYAEETGKVLSDSDLMKIWADEESRMEALARMKEASKYSKVISAATELSQQFEKGDLHRMYQRVRDAIREVDTTHILFLEHAYFSNAGVPSGLYPPKGKDGKPDPLVAYAAHGYDLLVDSKYYDRQSNERVGWIFSQIRETSLKLGIPVLVGEWGAFHGNSDGNLRSAEFIRNLFDRYRFSQTYWAYYEGIDEHSYFDQVFLRPTIQWVSGGLTSVSFEEATGSFNCTWTESDSIAAPTVIYLPDTRNLIKESIRLEPDPGNLTIQAMDGCASGFLIIPPSGKGGRRSVDFRVNSNTASISIQ
jgi:endoglycosylceramidase